MKNNTLSLVIKIISVIIGIMLCILSRYLFLFFCIAMIPSALIHFMDKEQKLLSATICNFNLIGVLPYIINIWNNCNLDFLSKKLFADIDTWMVIYGITLFGQIFYILTPMLINKIYQVKILINIKKYEAEKSQLIAQWNFLDDKI